MGVIGFTAQVFGRLAPDTQAGVHQHPGKHQLQRCIRQAVRQHQPERRRCYADQCDKQRRPITHQPLTQTQHCANRRCHAYGQQADRCSLDHRQPQAEHQQGHSKNATAGAGQRQHRTD
ncbi:hypothetical protein O162_34325, partial [Pseudomonas putida SJ3]